MLLNSLIIKKTTFSTHHSTLRYKKFESLVQILAPSSERYCCTSAKLFLKKRDSLKCLSHYEKNDFFHSPSKSFSNKPHASFYHTNQTNLNFKNLKCISHPFSSPPTDFIQIHRIFSLRSISSTHSNETQIQSQTQTKNNHESNSTNESNRHSKLPFSSLSPILPFLRPHWPLITRAWICTLISISSLLLFVPKMGEISTCIAEGNLNALFKTGTFVVFLVFTRALAQYWQDTWLWTAALEVTKSVRIFVYEKLHKADISHFEGKNSQSTGDIAYRISVEAEITGDVVFSVLHALVPSLFQLIAMLGRMLFISPMLTLATLLVIPFMSIIIAFLGERQRNVSQTAQTSIASISSYLNEVIPAMLLVRAHGAAKFEVDKFADLAEKDKTARLHKKQIKSFFPHAITASYVFVLLSLMAVGSYLIGKGKMKGSDLVSFFTSLVLLIEPIQAVGSAYNELKQGEPALERLFSITKIPSNVVDSSGGIEPQAVTGNVFFDSVYFTYDENAHTNPQNYKNDHKFSNPATLDPERNNFENGPQVSNPALFAQEKENSGNDNYKNVLGFSNPASLALENITLHVDRGQKVALVGPSGSGKTTLIKLLLRLYDPLQGTIFIDGIDIKEMNIKFFRKCIGIVPQETILFSGTVAENIAYGEKPDNICMTRVMRAAKLANADEFVSRFPLKYDSFLSERATSLSGGQRQRLAIARAIYHEPSILILDEATSALDNKSEKVVREALENLMKNRTVFIIAHRLETVKSADKIVYLEKGKVKEIGNHATLISQNGKYSSLYRVQVPVA